VKHRLERTENQAETCPDKDQTNTYV